MANFQYPMKSQFPMSQLEIEQLDIHWDLVIGELEIKLPQDILHEEVII